MGQLATLGAALLFASCVCAAASTGANLPRPPSHTGTAAAYDRATRTIDAYIASTTADAQARSGAQPFYAFHGPGEKVYGTALVFHGGFGKPADAVKTTTYLHANRWNVYAPPLAGHAFEGTRWPSTRLRGEYGGDLARQLLLADPLLGSIAEGINNGTLMAPVHVPDGFDYDEAMTRALTVLREGMEPAAYDTLLDAFELLVTANAYPSKQASLHKYFETDHMRYATVAAARVMDVVSLPGPVVVVGYSMGGVQALYASAWSDGLVSRAVLYAPFVDAAAPAESPRLRHLLQAVGALDLYDVPVPNDTTIPSVMLPAASLVGHTLLDEDLHAAVRRQTDVFCVFAEDDNMADVTLGLRVCRDGVASAGSRSYVYPAQLELGHFAAPSPMNPYSTPLLQETWRFLTTGEIRAEQMLNQSGDATMPSVDEMPAMARSHLARGA
ncbi:hypothetical protein MMPV_005738 [Pyropia vietnamensis]